MGDLNFNVDDTFEPLSNKNNIQDIKIYRKRINDDNIIFEKIDKKSKIYDFVNIIKLLIPKSKGKFLKDIHMSHNCNYWVKNLLFNKNNNDDELIKYLLNDFSSGMNTRMREENKYVVAILCENHIILCHSDIGQKTITPQFNIVERMLDPDNVKRFVYFKKSDDNILVKYYELYRSRFIVEWLGLPEKEAYYYLGGTNRFHFEIESLPCVIELNDYEFEKKMVYGKVKFLPDENCIELSHPLNRIYFNTIQMEKQKISNTNDFMLLFKSRQYNFTLYQKKFKEIRDSFTGTLENICLIGRYIDCDDSVRKYEFSNEDIDKLSFETIVSKDSTNEMNIIFASRLTNGLIEFETKYLKKIYSEFINNSTIKIFHAGMDCTIDNRPFKLSSLEIYNRIETSEVIKAVINHYTKGKLSDVMLNRAILYTIIQLLIDANKDLPIQYLLEKIANELSNNIPKTDIVYKDENKVLEYKSADVFSRRDDEIVDYILKDLPKKSSYPFKIYIFGIDDDKNVEPISIHKFDSGRIGNIQEKIQTQWKGSINLIQVPLDDKKHCLFIMTVLDNDTPTDVVNFDILNIESMN